MKRTLVIAAMMLFCFLVRAQEADGTGSGAAELSVIARAEYLNVDPLGNTSLYTLLDGEISTNLSYSVEAHWLSSDPLSLYANTLRSDDVSWLDWAYLTYSFSDRFQLALGKEALLWGTFENDEYDFDIHFPFASSVWNNVSTYQWGVRFSWLPIEGVSLDLKAAASPYGEYPFASNLFVYGAKFGYENEDLGALMVAANAFETEKGVFEPVISAGAQLYLGDATITADFNSRAGDPENIFVKGFTSSLKADYAFGDALNIMAVGMYENIADTFEDITAGVAVHYCPIEELRLHLTGGYKFGNFAPGALFSIGATYTFSLSL